MIERLQDIVSERQGRFDLDEDDKKAIEWAVLRLSELEADNASMAYELDQYRKFREYIWLTDEALEKQLGDYYSVDQGAGVTEGEEGGEDQAEDAALVGQG